MKLKELVTRFLAAKQLSVRARTLEWYHYNLDPLAEVLGEREVEELSTEDLEGFLAGQYEGRSPKTQEGFYTALNTFIRWLQGRGYLERSPMNGIKSPRKRRRQTKIPEIFTEAEIRAMLRAVGNRRDRAVLLTLLDTGLRRAELLRLDVKDVDFAEGFLKVHGKGGKDRFVPIESESLHAIREYLMDHPRHGPLWQNRFGERFQAGGLRSMLNRLKKKAGLTCPVHPHKFRHTFARYYLKSGDLESLREILGHADIRITAETYGTFLKGWIKEKHRRCSPVSNGNWDQAGLEL